MDYKYAKVLVLQPSGSRPVTPGSLLHLTPARPNVPYRCCSLGVVLCPVGWHCASFPSLTEWCSHRTHGDLVSGLYQHILLSLQKILADPVRPLCCHYGAVVGLHALGWKVSILAFLTDRAVRTPICVRKIVLVCLYLQKGVCLPLPCIEFWP